jgi:hypothetical protein
VDGQAAAQGGMGEVAGRLPAPVAEKWRHADALGTSVQARDTRAALLSCDILAEVHRARTFILPDLTNEVNPIRSEI